jgi:hypothetical protein
MNIVQTNTIFHDLIMGYYFLWIHFHESYDIHNTCTQLTCQNIFNHQTRML